MPVFKNTPQDQSKNTENFTKIPETLVEVGVEIHTDVMLPTRYRQFLIPFFLLQITLQTNMMFAQKTKGGAPKIDIQNFQAKEISSAELLVSVDYYYEKFDTSDLAILATTNGIGNIDDEAPLRHGNNTVSLKLRIRATSSEFTSSSIRVCISTPDSAILCKDFAYTKKWTPIADANQQPIPKSGNTNESTVHNLPTLSSVIAGRISGQIEYDVVTEPGGKPQRMTLKYVFIEPVNKGGLVIPVKVVHRKFRFTTTPGKKYKIYPANFPSIPRFKIITTREMVTHFVNFKITGQPLID
jgi:hypothetical protein